MFESLDDSQQRVIFADNRCTKVTPLYMETHCVCIFDARRISLPSVFTENGIEQIYHWEQK